MKPIDADLIRAFNDVHGGIALSETRPAELAIELEQLRTAMELVSAKVTFDSEAGDFRAALIELAQGSIR